MYVTVFVGFMAELAVSPKASACKSDTECKGDRVCEVDRCVAPKVSAVAPCRQDTDCRGDHICEQSVCVPPQSAVTPSAVVAMRTTSPALAAAPTPVFAAAPGMPAAAPDMPAAGAVAPAQAAPPPAEPPPGALAAGPATTATTLAVPATADTGPTKFSSLAVILPDRTDFYGLSGHLEYKVPSMSTPSFAATMGLGYGGIFYTGGGEVSMSNHVLALTAGVRPKLSPTISVAARAGVGALLTHMAYAGESKNDFSGAALVGGDVTYARIMVGVEGWMRNGSLWMLRAGISW